LPTQLLVDPMVEAERRERVALGHALEGDQPEALRVLLDELEVETGGDVGRAGPVEEILDRPVRPVAVSRAARLAHPAVVDQQRVAGVGEPGGYLIDEGDRTIGEHGLLSDSESEIVAGGWVAKVFDESIAVEADHHLLRPRGGAAETAERKVVHELVRQDQLRGALHALGDLDPFGRVERPPGSRARLDGRVLHIETSKVLDELSSERPVARPHLCQQQGSWLPQAVVEIHDGASEQLREDRMDVRAGHEMGVGADRWTSEEASRTVERQLHVLGERDRSVVPDRARDGVARIHELQGTGSWVASVPVSDEIRQAASLIGVRDGPDGPEVLVIERTLDHRFLPGYVAFPGGAVDPADEALAARWFGDEQEAVRAAALRELAEEVGLAVTREAVVAVDRDRLLVPIHDAPPPVERLREVARWIAPAQVPVRFDARYYAVRMDGAADPVPDGAEAAKAWWASPRSLLSAWESEELLFYWPTHFTMRALADCRDTNELLGLHIVTREPDDDESGRLPRSVFSQD
jgi:8-oxo-dGTP pyrophosphatase MutT (NUDIX family)